MCRPMGQGLLCRHATERAAGHRGWEREGAGSADGSPERGGEHGQLVRSEGDSVGSESKADE
jgi:hypothetical protein